MAEASKHRPNEIAFVIPAYNPTRELISLVAGLRENGAERILVVDDGSGVACQAIFEELAADGHCQLTRHGVNLGKGRAIKTGLNAVLLRWPDARGFVTADGDGQHLVEDIIRVAAGLCAEPAAVVLGTRTFHPSTPWKSQVGNRFTSFLFHILGGLRLADTQTGLRGFPIALAARLMSLEGERYEYELNVLLALRQWRQKIVEIPIATVYRDGNRGSHFNPILDSMAVFAVLLRFTVSSLVTSGVDYLIFAAAFSQTGSIPVSLAIGRAGATIVNLTLNREFVFRAQPGWRLFVLQMVKYYSLVLLLAVVSYGLIRLGTEALGLTIIAAKVIAEVLLFPVSFVIQRDVVFRGPTRASQ